MASRILLFTLIVSAWVSGCTPSAKVGQKATQAATASQPQNTIAELGTAKPAEVGRYTVVHSPHVESDTILLDTATGDTWQLQVESGGNLIWEALKKSPPPLDLSSFEDTPKAGPEPDMSMFGPRAKTPSAGGQANAK